MMTAGGDKPFKKIRYYAMTRDPVHIGTGGYRLGRVDNAIVREPGTNLPKIPGSAIAGPARAYTAMAIQSADPTRKKFRDGDKSCAGKGGKDGDSHCGEPNCEVCVTYGFSRGSGSSFQGLAQFSDAQILFFPVHSMLGPVWVTCPGALRDVLSESQINNKLADDSVLQTSIVPDGKELNLGWLLLKNKVREKPLNITIPNIWNEIQDKLVLLPNKLFSRVVNDNLDVRTSVAIDPFTGAAEDGALFTFEAIPRATIMWFEVVYSEPKYFRIKFNGNDEEIRNPNPDDTADVEWLRRNVEKGLQYFEALGLGGMNTRGMGRLRKVHSEEVINAYNS